MKRYLGFRIPGGMKVVEGETLSFENNPGDLFVVNDTEEMLKEEAVGGAIKKLLGDNFCFIAKITDVDYRRMQDHSELDFLVIDMSTSTEDTPEQREVSHE